MKSLSRQANRARWKAGMLKAERNDNRAPSCRRTLENKSPCCLRWLQQEVNLLYLLSADMERAQITENCPVPSSSIYKSLRKKKQGRTRQTTRAEAVFAARRGPPCKLKTRVLTGFRSLPATMKGHFLCSQGLNTALFKTKTSQKTRIDNKRAVYKDTNTASHVLQPKFCINCLTYEFYACRGS